MKVAVYCSSSNQINDTFLTLAEKIGTFLAEHNYDLIFGGSNVGMMLKCAEAMHVNNGHIIGIIPELIYNKGLFYTKCDELILTKDMHERKDKIIEKADAFLILPGGIGTLDEFFATITLQQLTYIQKPIVLYNHKNYFSDILSFLNMSVNEHFSRVNLHDLYRVTDKIENLKELLDKVQEKSSSDKWL